MALFIPELLSSVACLANILITIFWKKRHTVLGRLVLMLNLSELIWPLTFTDYLQNREWAPNEINIFFLLPGQAASEMLYIVFINTEKIAFIRYFGNILSFVPSSALF